MKKQLRHNRIVALIFGLAIFAFAGWASADPPTRVARLGYADGAVSFSPAGEDEWVQAAVNRPFITGDRLWVDAGARAELQVGSAVMRISDSTSLTLLDLDDSVVQLQLAQGTLTLHVRRFEPDDVIEVDTPNLAFVIRQPGDYRIEVDPESDATTVVTRSGRAEVFGEGTAYTIAARSAYRFFGVGLRDYDEFSGPPPADEFDRWGYRRDRRWERSLSSRYVSPDVIGYQDLDDYGAWRADARYGNVWIPNRVPADWSPYHYGHWTWIEPWGWTWVDDAPWGFAVSHYGRWTDLGGTWGWVPGPVRSRAVYAPALVAFVGGPNFQLSISSGNVGGIAWFPLGPRDVYRPAYPVSRGYFSNINTSNTVINNTHITNVYNNTNVTNITYVNQKVRGAVIAVPATAFAQSQPVSKFKVRMPQDKMLEAPVVSVAAVAPKRESVMGTARPAGSKPPEAVLERPVFANRTPPAAPTGFARKEHLFATNPGKPLDAAELGTLKPAEPVASRKIQVIAPAQSSRPTAAPPVTAPSEQRRKFERRVQPAAPAAQSETAAPPSAAPEQRRNFERRVQPSAPAAQPEAAAQPSEQRRQFERRIQPAAPAAQSETAAPPSAAPEQRRNFERRVQPAAPATQPETAAPPSEQRRNFERRVQPVAPAMQPETAATSNGPAGKGEQPKTDAARNKKKKSAEQLKQEEQLRLDEEEKRRRQ